MALNIGVGLSTEIDPETAAQEAVRRAKINLHNKKVDLAIVFSSVDLASLNLLNGLSDAVKNAPIIGCSGAAVICNQGIFKHGIVALLLGLPQHVFFNTASVKDIKIKSALSAGRELGEKLLYGFKDVRRDLSMILSDGLLEEGSNLIYGLQEKLGRSFPLVGASASDNMRFAKSYLYFNREIFSDGALGILWGGKLNFGLGIKHGWKPLGKPRTVTAAQGNIVYEIDDKPAINIYEEYLGCDANKLQKELKRISVLYPIGIFLSGETEYLLRNIVSLEKGGALHFQGNVVTGSQIRLMIGTKESCFAATKQAAAEAKNRLLGANPDTAALGKNTNNFVLVFNSASRYMLLRREAGKEIEIIQNEFGKDTPIVGLYTYGEQAPLRAVSYQGQAYFHNQTITTLTIGG